MNIKSIVSLGLSASLLLGATACNNEPFPEGDPLFPTATTEIAGQAAYLAAPKANTIPMEAFFADYQYLGATITRGEAATFSIKLTEPAKAKTTVKLELVPAAEVMAAYEAIYGDKTEIKGVAPDGLFALENATVEIEAGKQEATATIVWGDKALVANITEDGKYLAAVRAASTTEGSLTKKLNTVFVGLKRATTYIKGYQAADFSTYTKVDEADFVAYGDAGWGPNYASANAFDGNLSSYWMLPVVSGEDTAFDVVFNNSTAIKGFRIGRAVGGAARRLRKAQIVLYDENDEVVLDLGEHDLNAFTLKNDYYHFEFFAPITFKRIMLYNAEPTNQYISITELEFYK